MLSGPIVYAYTGAAPVLDHYRASSSVVNKTLARATGRAVCG
jgi:hypothetical protein